MLRWKLRCIVHALTGPRTEQIVAIDLDAVYVHDPMPRLAPHLSRYDLIGSQSSQKGAFYAPHACCLALEAQLYLLHRLVGGLEDHGASVPKRPQCDERMPISDVMCNDLQTMFNDQLT